MMTNNVLAKTFLIAEILEQGDDEGTCRILHAFGEMGAQTVVELPQSLESTVQKVEATMLPLPDSDANHSLLLRLEIDPDIDVFQIIPETFEVRDRQVHRLCDVVDAVHSPLIRRFLSDVFSLRPVFFSFWTSPGSQNHHHAYRGGLADHTLEVAENVLQSPGLSETERDIGIAFALSHDLGKIWTYQPDNVVASIVGHELAGLAELHGPLARLECDWPQAGGALRGLLAGRWRKGGGRPFLSVGKLVQAYDEASAERDRTRAGWNHGIANLVSAP